MNKPSFPVRTTMNIALAQYGLRTLEHADDFWSHLSNQIELACANQVDLMVFPEYLTAHLLSTVDEMDHLEACTFLDQFTERYISFFRAMSIGHQVHLVGGTHITKVNDHFVNRAYLFYPDGQVGYQDKIHLTPEEQKKWPLLAGNHLQIFDTMWGKCAILICYDIEFPELARIAAEQDVKIILCPSYTDNAFGYHRVRLCAQARAIENQLFVCMSGIVGELKNTLPQLDWGHSQAAVFSPCDLPFEADGIVTIGPTNEDMIVYASIDFEQLTMNRQHGLVAPFFDRKPHIYPLIRSANTRNSITS